MEEERGGVCLEEEVVRLYERGLSEGEIAQTTGMDPGWIHDLISRIAEDSG